MEDLKQEWENRFFKFESSSEDKENRSMNRRGGRDERLDSSSKIPRLNLNLSEGKCV